MNALCGLMWNIPVTDRHRRILAGHWAFYPCLAAVLSQKQLQRSHFSCLHVLTTLISHGIEPNGAPANSSFTKYMASYLASAESRRSGEHGELQHVQDVGVALSLRDVADFFLPLLRSKSIDCVTFGKWAMTIFYWNSTDIYV